MSDSISRFLPSRLSSSTKTIAKPTDWRRTVRVAFPWVVMVAAAALGVAVVAMA